MSKSQKTKRGHKDRVKALPMPEQCTATEGSLQSRSRYKLWLWHSPRQGQARMQCSTHGPWDFLPTCVPKYPVHFSISIFISLSGSWPRTARTTSRAHTTMAPFTLIRRALRCDPPICTSDLSQSFLGGILLDTMPLFCQIPFPFLQTPIFLASLTNKLLSHESSSQSLLLRQST